MATKNIKELKCPIKRWDKVTSQTFAAQAVLKTKHQSKMLATEIQTSFSDVSLGLFGLNWSEGPWVHSFRGLYRRLARKKPFLQKGPHKSTRKTQFRCVRRFYGHMRPKQNFLARLQGGMCGVKLTLPMPQETSCLWWWHHRALERLFICRDWEYCQS